MLDLQSTVVRLHRELQALLLPGHEDHDQHREAEKPGGEAGSQEAEARSNEQG